MVASDIFFMFFVIFGAMHFEGIWTGITCIEININPIIFMWLGFSDFVIGTYCLFVFVLPLRKYIKLERTTSNSNELATIAKKITIFSSLMLITSMMATIISAIASYTASFVYTIDLTVNAVCIVYQFGTTDTTTISSKYIRCFIEFLQCEYGRNDEKQLSNIIGSIDTSHKITSRDGPKEAIESTKETQQSTSETEIP